MKIEKSFLALGNEAFLKKEYKKAASFYKKALLKNNELSEIIKTNLNKIKEKTGIDFSVEKLLPGVQIELNQLNESDQEIYKRLKAFDLDWSNYFEENDHTFVSDDPILDYVASWKDSVPKLSGIFDTEYYLTLYPDIKAASINPLEHFLSHGREEGRQGFFDSKGIKTGHFSYDSSKETIVLVSHESSATGAPLLGYNIALSLSKKYNIAHIVLNEKNIHSDFVDTCFSIYSNVPPDVTTNATSYLKFLQKTSKIKCVIINSIVGYPALYAAHALNIPTVFLIHEFSEYMRPSGIMMSAAILSDIVVLPAEIIKESLLKEFIRFRNHKGVPHNLKISPQGKLPVIPCTFGKNFDIPELYKKMGIADPSNTKIIVGAGYTQIRKGVDLFLLVARYIKKLYKQPCKFVWVGDGFNPDLDLAYSVYLKNELDCSGLDDDFIFLEHQKNLDTIFSISDVFCLPARLDPFPNVIIDALSHDLHIACFEKGTGSAEFLKKHNANCTVVDLPDVYAMAEGIVSYFKNTSTQKNQNKMLVEKHLNFENYINTLDLYIEEAVDFRRTSEKIVATINESGQFDPIHFGSVDFIPGHTTDLKKCQIYVDNALKGIHNKNPKVAFSSFKWLSDKKLNPFAGVVPLYEGILENKLFTHVCSEIPNQNKNEEISFVYAVHIHLYYLDLSQHFLNYLKNLPGTFDVYITVVYQNAKKDIEAEFSQCGARKCFVKVVENIGRDVGPFLLVLRDILVSGTSDYKVIGHFHSKKSSSLTDSGLGAKWRDFLLDSLIGNNDSSTSILSIFNNDKVGLVFTEDTNNIGICDNKEFVVGLCEMLNLPLIEETPLFPVGNMFWANIDAIKALATLNLESILQPEPLPYDGTFMHALERITPHLVEQSGYTFQTIYSKDTKDWL